MIVFSGLKGKINKNRKKENKQSKDTADV